MFFFVYLDYIARNGRLSENEARRIFQQIISAVDYCHSIAGVCHRDLKAENLLLDADWQIKLADFGFSNYYTKDNTLCTFCGSPPYAAPEVFEGKKYFGTEIDIWSLGVILYVLVCGVLPFDASTLPLLRDRVLSGRYRIPYFMSSDCESLLRKLLVVEPCKRYTLEQVKSHRWIRSVACIDRHFSEIDLNNRLIDSSPRLDEPLEPVLKLIESLGIDPNRTKESLKNKAFDNFTAIYLLLMDRWHSETGVKRRVSFSVANRSESPHPENHSHCKKRSPTVAQTHNFAAFYRTIDSIGAPSQAQSSVTSSNVVANEFGRLISYQNSDNDTSSMNSDSGVDFSLSENSSLSRQSTLPFSGQFSFSMDEQTIQPLITPSPPLNVQSISESQESGYHGKHWKTDSPCDQFCLNCRSSCSNFCSESCTSTTSNSSASISTMASTSATTFSMPQLQPHRLLGTSSAINAFDSFDSQIEHDFMASLSSCPPSRFDDNGQLHSYGFNDVNAQPLTMVENVTGLTSGSFSVDSTLCPAHLFNSVDTQTSFATTNAAHCLCSTTWSQNSYSKWAAISIKNLRSSDTSVAPNFSHHNFPRLTANDRTNGFIGLNVKSQWVDAHQNDAFSNMHFNSSQYSSESSRNAHQIFGGNGCEDSPHSRMQLISQRRNLPEKFGQQPSKLLTMKQSLQIEQQLQDEKLCSSSASNAKNCSFLCDSMTSLAATGSPLHNATSKAAYLHQQRMQTFHQKKQNIQSRRQYFVRQVSYQLAQNQPILPPNAPVQCQLAEKSSNKNDHSPTVRLRQQQKLLHLPTENNFKVESGGRHVVSTPLSPIE
uniref:Protein kinase domain-containing protein n=1 Tax=Romanomermis culicivorax TaxID=13658 RepID=A0A915J7M8_ROMCU